MYNEGFYLKESKKEEFKDLLFAKDRRILKPIEDYEETKWTDLLLEVSPESVYERTKILGFFLNGSIRWIDIGKEVLSLQEEMVKSICFYHYDLIISEGSGFYIKAENTDEEPYQILENHFSVWKFNFRKYKGKWIAEQSRFRNLHKRFRSLVDYRYPLEVDPVTAANILKRILDGDDHG